MRTIFNRATVLGVVFGFAAAAVCAQANVTLSSAEDTTFSWTNTMVELSGATVTATAAETVTNGTLLVLRMPSTWQSRFDTDVTPALSGTGAGHVDTASMAYTDAGRALEIAVTNDFANGDALTIADLRLVDPRLARQGTARLVLALLADGEPQAEVEDDKTLTCDVFWTGGLNDGWDIDRMGAGGSLGGADVVMSSGQDQPFNWTDAGLDLATLTVTVVDVGTPPVITNTVIMQLRAPSAWQSRFDPGITPTLAMEPGASGAVGATSFADGGSTLLIPVTADFASSDALTIDGLRLIDLPRARHGAVRMALDFDGDGLIDVLDAYTLVCSVTWPGGLNDGWDIDRMALALEVWRPMGTLFLLR